MKPIYSINKTLQRADLTKIFYMFKWKFTHKKHPDYFDEDHPCVFVLSTGRVGSETLTYILKKCKNALVYHEPLPELFGLSKKAYELYPGYLEDEKIYGVLKEGFLTARRALFEHALYCDRGYIEAGPPSTFLAPIINVAIPEVKFIHLIRSPLAVIKSGLRRGWYSGHPYDKTRIVPNPSSDFGQNWENFTQLEKNSWLWSETNRWISDYLINLNADKTLTLHSEDLFGANEETINRLFTFINQPVPVKKDINKVLSRKLNAQTTGVVKDKIDDWNIREPVYRFLKQTANFFGYEV